ncbi:hypothetical protein GCM10009733_072960 [Nonomuraea maheshkhaliensis]|uniref:Uncharacterized protein n=1 Tax=Nonomuraea maheshkhaliensis TaxID=419590 RepID=A0ABN2G3J2_9ACTN
MHQESAIADIRELCTELPGERLGPKMAALAQPGLALKPAGPDKPPTGRCRAGAPALLEPAADHDSDLAQPVRRARSRRTGPLSRRASAHPARPVNVFSAVGSVSEECTIICADPACAVDVPVPPPGDALSTVRLHAVPIMTLPAVSGEFATGDPILEAFDYRAEPDFHEDHWESSVERYVQGPLREEWRFYCQDEQGFTLGDSQAFGWPHIDSSIGMRADGYAHLLTLSGDLWDGNGVERVMVPPSAVRIGRFTDVICEMDGLH